MVEFCLAIPFLAFIIAMIFFFGTAMRGQQKVRHSARHAAWRQALTASAPVDADTLGETLRELSAGAGDSSTTANSLFVLSFPGYAESSMSTGLPSDVEIYRKFEGSISGYHAREGVPWTLGQAGVESELRSTYLAELDQQIQQMDSDAKSLADAMRALYNQRW